MAEQMNGRFDDVAHQLTKILGAVAKHPVEGHTGVTPPSKAARSSSS